MPKAKPLKKWERFWRLTALWESKSLNWWKSTYELCKCDCWTIKWQNRNMIRRWRIISCWCARNEAWRKNLTKAVTVHGMAYSRIYSIFRWIKIRCENKNNPNYRYYWLLWIKCLRKTFEQFRDDMYESYVDHVAKYGERETTIDRINVNWNYCKENCRWATRGEQAKNKRKQKIS